MSAPRSTTGSWRSPRERLTYPGRVEATGWSWTHAERQHDNGLWDAAILVTIPGIERSLTIRSEDPHHGSQETAREENGKLAAMVAEKLGTDTPPATC